VHLNGLRIKVWLQALPAKRVEVTDNVIDAPDDEAKSSVIGKPSK